MIATAHATKSQEIEYRPEDPCIPGVQCDDQGRLHLIGGTTYKEFEHQENILLRKEVDRASIVEEIVGASTALRAVLSEVSKVAPTDSTVLITGETGTGKELIARAIHKRSRRSSRP